MILHIRHEFRRLDGSDVAAFMPDMSSLIEEEGEYELLSDSELEWLLPSLPGKFQFQDLKWYGLDWENLRALEKWNETFKDPHSVVVNGVTFDASSFWLRKAGINPDLWDKELPHEEMVEIHLPEESLFLVYPCQDKYTFKCYDCDRPLFLFNYVMYDPHYPRGYCTYHVMERGMARPAYEEECASRRQGAQKTRTYTDFLADWERDQVLNWHQVLREAWDKERQAETEKYKTWKNQQLALLRGARSPYRTSSGNVTGTPKTVSGSSTTKTSSGAPPLLLPGRQTPTGRTLKVLESFDGKP